MSDTTKHEGRHEEAKRPKAAPKPGPVTKGFWDAAKEHRLVLQYDPVARRHQFFPRPMSLYGTAPLEWKEASGRGTLVAVTLCRTPAPGFEGEVPYLIGLVKLEEGPRVFAQLVNTAPDEAKIGGAMRLVWDDSRAGYPMYQFEPAP